MLKNSLNILLLTISLLAINVSADEEKTNAIYDNELNQKDPLARFDEYPMVVPKRGRALLLDRLIVALRQALEDDEESKDKAWSMTSSPQSSTNDGFSDYQMDYGADSLAIGGPMSRVAPGTMDDEAKRIVASKAALQRRGNTSVNIPKGRVWRCYFNAVTCFRRK